MKREMRVYDWNGKKIKSAQQGDGNTFNIRFEDGSTATLSSEDAKLEVPEKFCNLCGESCKLTPEDDGSGLIDTTVSGGYESTPGNGEGALDDCTKYTFSLCEFCLDWLFSQFQIPVFSISYIDGIAEDWMPAADRVAKDDWRSQKERFFKEFERRNAARLKK